MTTDSPHLQQHTGEPAHNRMPKPTHHCAALAAMLPHYGLDGLLITDNANLFYATGVVYAGYCLVNADGEVHLLVRRPIGPDAPHVHYIRKVEQLPEVLGAALPHRLGIAMDSISVADFRRIEAALPSASLADASALLRRARAVKDTNELALLRACGQRHVAAYAQIPTLYHAGMTDIDLQIELERTLRREGCLGLFRVHGNSMELFMASVLTGDNADTASPYDFAMGGAGLHPSIPVGANGTTLQIGHPVMVDACGNFNGYMTDMTRVYSVSTISDALTVKAHRCSLDIHRRLLELCRPGTPASALYHAAAQMAAQAGLDRFFMGHRQQAGFVGHGVGIEVNEAPVLAPKSRETIEIGNVLAIEPKFVIPGIGAVGIENTYYVGIDGVECLTPAPEQIVQMNE